MYYKFDVEKLTMFNYCIRFIRVLSGFFYPFGCLGVFMGCVGNRNLFFSENQVGKGMFLWGRWLMGRLGWDVGVKVGIGLR